MARRAPKFGQFIKSSAPRRALTNTRNTCTSASLPYPASPRFTESFGFSNSVEANRDFASMGKSRGNENRRWHGTRRKCNLGDKGVTNFCTDSKCSLCCIIKTSFDLRFFKGATGWGRFGAGIYTSSTSSKFVSVSHPRREPDVGNLSSRSNDYSANDCVSNWKALLLNKVVVGKGLKLVLDDPTLTGPPAGFDSVSTPDRSFLSGVLTGS